MLCTCTSSEVSYAYKISSLWMDDPRDVQDWQLFFLAVMDLQAFLIL
jgi:hypothetical protein